MFCAFHDQLASLGRHAQLTRCFSAVAELLVINNICSFINNFIFIARCYAECGYAAVYCPSVCPSVCPCVTFRYRDHIGRNSSKIVSRPNSLRPQSALLGRSGGTGTPPKLGSNRGGVTQEHKKPAKSPKRCKIGLRLLVLRTNRKSYAAYARFRLVPKSTTLNGVSRDCTAFLKYSLLSQERVKLRTSNLAGTFITSVSPSSAD